MMMKHIVCFKLKDNAPENVAKAAQVLGSMEGNVPMIRAMEIGTDFLHSPRSYDIILQVTLDDEAALDAYQNDPYHCNTVKTHMHAVCEASVAVDYYL